MDPMGYDIIQQSTPKKIAAGEIQILAPSHCLCRDGQVTSDPAKMGSG